MSANEQFRHRVLRDPAYFVASGFGSGLAPKAPGTAGTVVGVILYVLLLSALPLPVYIAVVAGALLLGVIVSTRVTRQSCCAQSRTASRRRPRRRTGSHGHRRRFDA